MRRLAPRRLAPALERVARDLEPPSLLGRIQRVWPEVAGAGLAQRAQPVSEHGRELVLRCEDAVWAEEIRLMSPELTGRLNEALGEGSLAGIRTVSGGLRVRH
ncbi:MAG: DUF721 domain-containing protein [Thermoleophilaceae bacterium]|nr:DUF721 domain-containing protein [Thermoleophilaceae bacterium]